MHSLALFSFGYIKVTLNQSWNFFFYYVFICFCYFSNDIFVLVLYYFKIWKSIDNQNKDDFSIYCVKMI